VSVMSFPARAEEPQQRPSLLAPDVDELLAGPEPAFEWVVDGLVEKRERTILTGPEGGGKSTLLRQIGLACASGLHPFTFEPIEPVRVLLFDLENGRRHVRRKFGELRHAAGERYETGHLRVHLAPSGIDLTRPADRAFLRELVDANRPEVLIGGPIYKMAGGDPNDERQAKAVSAALDVVREEFGCAIVLEAHSPHASNGSTRSTRPYGASLWMRWPEFGIYLGKEGGLQHWRGPRDEREWPARLRRGGEWPWTIAPDEHTIADDGTWRPTVLMERASRKLEFLTAANDLPSRSALSDAVTGKKQFLLQAIDVLIAENYVERDGRKLRSVRPYREDEA
jgi:energy-coupling factor transporter ATP-binding protein EcfA2